MKHRNFHHRMLLPVALLAAGTLAGCDGLDSLLEVENPGRIGEVALNDPLLIPAIVNTAVGQFHLAYDELAIAGAILTDEVVNGHNFEQWRAFDLREIDRTNTILNSEVYSPLHRARVAAEDGVARVREVLGETAAGRDLGAARLLAYSGYSHVVLAEYFCESPLAADQPAKTSDETMQLAIQRFDDAIRVATAARAAGVSAARTDSIIHMSRVGAARAHLWLNNRPQAATYASQVPADFRVWVTYGQATSAPNNRFQNATTGSSRFIGVDAPFRGLNDPRVRHEANSVRGHNGSTDLWIPFVSPAFSGWNPATPTRFENGTSILLSSGLEARYIVAEAQGLNATNLQFLNSRRAVGNQTALATLTEAQFLAELRDQRRRDFFLGGYRLGDLRRYIRHYNLDLFPTGRHPNASWNSNYGTATCFIPHNNERVGNPNYRP